MTGKTRLSTFILMKASIKKEFIQNYFRQGCKFSAVREAFGSENGEILFRYHHSVFVFFYWGNVTEKNR